MDRLYWIIGIMVFMNIGTIATIAYGMGKFIWFCSKMDSRVEKNTNDVGAAHSKIREINRRLLDGEA